MTLECLEALTRRYSSQFKENTKKINAEVSALMGGDDLQRSTLALRIVKNQIISNPTLALHDVAMK
jgi:hypothetical protein